MRRTIVASALLLSTLVGGNAAPAADRADYLRDIKPILQARCYPCHGSLQQKAKLRLDTAELMRTGGKHGPAVVASKSGDSLLIERVTASDGAERMPPETQGAPLSARQIALLKAWIDQGATAPREAIPEDPRKHWAYQTPVRPALPKVRNAGWVRNPIDAFIPAEHAKRGLQRRPAAAKEVLLRRVSLDLIGVPPTRDEIPTFLAAQPSATYAN